MGTKICLPDRQPAQAFKLKGKIVCKKMEEWPWGILLSLSIQKRVKNGGNNQNLKLFLRGKHCYVRVYMSIVQRLSKVNVCFLITYR